MVRTPPRGIPSESQRDALFAHFRPRFPPVHRDAYGDEILTTVLNTPARADNFHSRLLTAMCASPRCGTFEQYLVALSIDLTASSDPLRTPTGSFERAMVQQLLEWASTTVDRERGERLLVELVDGLADGIGRPELEELMGTIATGEIFPFEVPLGLRSAIDQLEGYQPVHRTMLARFVHGETRESPARARGMVALLADARTSGSYDPLLIDRVLDEAEDSVSRSLMLRRLYQVFVVQDLPAKVLGLLPDDDTSETQRILSDLESAGRAPQAMADAIRGTRHTGYLDDRHLAAKTVEVMARCRSFIDDPTQREPARDRLEQAFWRALRSGALTPLDPDTLVSLFETNHDDQAARLANARQEGRVVIDVLSGDAFDREALAGPAPSAHVSLLVSRLDKTEPPRILIRELPELDVRTDPGEWRAFSEVMRRLKGLAHETEHFEHFAGTIELVRNMSRRDRMVSEGMALLAELDFRVRNIDQLFVDVARRTRQTVVSYMLDVTDAANFAHINREMLAVG